MHILRPSVGRASVHSPCFHTPLALRFRGPGRLPGAKSQKVSKKVSRGRVPEVRKSLEKGPKRPPKTHFPTFFDLSDLFGDFLRTFGTQPRETFSETFLAFGPETPSPRSAEPQHVRLSFRGEVGRGGRNLFNIGI